MVAVVHVVTDLKPSSRSASHARTANSSARSACRARPRTALHVLRAVRVGRAPLHVVHAVRVRRAPLHVLGPNSMETFQLEFRLEKPLEIWLA